MPFILLPYLRSPPYSPFSWLKNFQDHRLCYWRFQIRLCQFHSNLHFFSQYPSSSARSNRVITPNNQHHLSTKFTPLASNSQRINFKLATLDHRSLHNTGSQYLSTSLYTPSRQLHSASLTLLTQRRINIALASRGFWHASPSLWKNLPHHLRSIDSYNDFKSILMTQLFSGVSIACPEQRCPCISDSTS